MKYMVTAYARVYQKTAFFSDINETVIERDRETVGFYGQIVF
jgi:hypothetical protein